MTPGQERALRELSRLQAVGRASFEILGKPAAMGDRILVSISLRIGPLEKRPGGLEFREREEFQLLIPADFPFDYPSLIVKHHRFAGFAHVCWSTTLCLYQSKIEWNPADGLYGYFDRLDLWIARAARNDMDPVEGPLEPPHFITDFSQLPVVIRSDAPTPAGSRWIGWALLEKLPNRIELRGWRELTDTLEQGQRAALAIILSEPLPMEFPQRGDDLFRELLKCGIERDLLLHLLRLAASVTPDDEPAHLIVGLPMRRAADGTLRLHIAVWTTAANYAKSLRLTIPEANDPESLRELRRDLADSTYAVFELTTIKWCQVFEDRDEIVVRRDARTPIACFKGKRVLLLGCGALGSWAAEIIARANPNAIHLVDNAVVKPGVLARQNYTLQDIGSAKADALAGRLRSIVHGTDVQAFAMEAHRFVLEHIDELSSYDIVIDCTASSVVQMKLERDWLKVGDRVRRFISLVIDATAQRLLAISLGPQSVDGPWSAYLRLKHRLCTEDDHADLVKAFYSARASDALFQPEPGCSDPTFSASTADVSRLTATVLNGLAANVPNSGETIVMAGSLPSVSELSGELVLEPLPPVTLAAVGDYRLLVARKAFNQARAFVRQNARLRSHAHETGGLLWGYWDDASRVIVILDASGPPPDSRHDPGHFVCGTVGTAEEHDSRMEQSHGVCGFAGMWHTHPDLPPQQSSEDVLGMTGLVAGFGQNRRRAVMLIFGRIAGQASVGAYAYEAQVAARGRELLKIGGAFLSLETPVV